MVVVVGCQLLVDPPQVGVVGGGADGGSGEVGAFAGAAREGAIRHGVEVEHALGYQFCRICCRDVNGGSLCIGRHARRDGLLKVFPEAFVAEEPESSVLEDIPACGSAELVAAQRILGLSSAVQEEVV